MRNSNPWRRVPGLDPPHISPVGLLECPANFSATPRTYSRSIRALAAVFLLSFVVVVSATTVGSLGTWCLTSQASAVPAQLPRIAGE